MFQPVKIKAHLHFLPSKVGWMERRWFHIPFPNLHEVNSN